MAPNEIIIDTPSLKDDTHGIATSRTQDTASWSMNESDGNQASESNCVTLNQKVDIITRSPHEIASHIFKYIAIETASLCLQVSHAWRRKLLQCPEPWHTVDSTNDTTVRCLLPTISHHVQKLGLLGTPAQLGNDINLLKNGDFSKLKSLTVQIECQNALKLLTDSNQHVDIICEHLYDALPNVAQSLVELCIERRFGKPGIPLNRILSICQKLTSIKITGYNVIDRSISCKSQLTHVYLDIEDSSLNFWDLEPIFRNSPNLRYFALDCSIQESIIPVIGNYCPHLSTIVTNRSIFDSYYSQCEPLQANNLHCLALDYLFDPMPLISRLQQYNDTLQTLCLALVEGAPSHHWQQLFSMTLPNLTYLQIYTGRTPMDFLHTHIAAMLRSNMSLQTLVLRHYYDHPTGLDTDPIYNAAAQLPHLSCLQLLNFGIYDDPFLRLLEKDSLQKLEISDCNGCTSVVLMRIARMAHLEHLTIHCVDMDVLVQEFEEFLAVAALCLVNLTHLNLGMMRISEEDDQLITSFKKLSSLTFVRTIGRHTDKRLRFLRDRIDSVEIVN